MNDPYKLLDLPPDADENRIRARYLELVRKHTPETDPARFAEIHEAYNLLRDPAARLKRELFRPCMEGTLDGLVWELQARLRTARLPLRTLLSLAELP